MSGSILVIGLYGQSAFHGVKRLPQPGESVLSKRVQFEPGGKGYNQALCACRMGCETMFATAVGEDLWGDQAEEIFRSDGFLRYRALRLPGTGTAFASVLAAEDGENVVVVNQGACGAVTGGMIETLEDLICRASVLLVQCELPVEALDTATALARRHGVYVMLNPAPAKPLPGEILQRVDLLTPNWTEAHQLCGRPVRADTDPAALAEALADLGSGAVVITMGSRGALLWEQGRTHYQEAFPVTAVDTTGAGDTFNGALAAELARGISVREALPFAAAASALCVGRSGVLNAIPTRARTEAFLRKAEEGITKMAVEIL